MLITSSPYRIGHNMHRLTIHYVIYLLMRDFTMNWLMDIPITRLVGLTLVNYINRSFKSNQTLPCLIIQGVGGRRGSTSIFSIFFPNLIHLLRFLQINLFFIPCRPSPLLIVQPLYLNYLMRLRYIEC